MDFGNVVVDIAMKERLFFVFCVYSVDVMLNNRALQGTSTWISVTLWSISRRIVPSLFQYLVENCALRITSTWISVTLWSISR